MPIILVTNDDGIDSPGLKAAVEAVLQLGTIIVLAPSIQQTATGRGLFGDKGLSLESVEFMVNDVKVEAYHCNCSPALIVRHGFRTILKDIKPDLLVSGINYGENLGINITSSGTIGAALEGASFGVPGIAISKQTDVSTHLNYTDQEWSASMYFLQKFAKIMLGSRLPDDVDLLKIDVPDDASPSTNWRVTNLARSPYYVKEIENPALESKLGDGMTRIQFDEEYIDHSSDIYAIAKEKIVSVTPVSLDMTSRVELKELGQMLNR
jgi:5'-nucleotidase